MKDIVSILTPSYPEGFGGISTYWQTLVCSMRGWAHTRDDIHDTSNDIVLFLWCRQSQVAWSIL